MRKEVSHSSFFGHLIVLLKSFNDQDFQNIHPFRHNIHSNAKIANIRILNWSI